MSNDMSFTYSVAADVDDIVCDDIFVKTTGKTLRKIRNGYAIVDPKMYCDREYYGTFIPTTDVDSALKIRDLRRCDNALSYSNRMRDGLRGQSISLRQHGLFNTIVDDLEKHCISKKNVYSILRGSKFTEYVLPVTGHVDSSTLYQEDIYKPIVCPKKQYVKPQQQPRRRKIRSYKYYETQKTNAEKARYICINGNMYSVDNVYKRSGTDFVPIIIHKDSDEPILNIDEKSVRNRRSVGTSITVSFIKDTNISGFVLEPEPMKFEYMYEDGDARRSQRNGRRFIKCLTNDPGYITKFELSYRSTQTDGMWVKYNIFDGNDCNHKPTKLVFDEEIVAKEIRIVPLSYQTSFEKVVVNPFTTIIPEEKNDDDATVSYYIETPYRESGKYVNVPDVLCGGKHFMRRTKGDKKIKQREFRELCNM